MKKRVLLWVMLIICLLLEGCGSTHNHNWIDATCTTPKKCEECGETKGTELGHDWKKATCTEAKTCTRCGATEGEALGHDWKEATCTEAKTCTRCGATEGEALEHDWKEATCTEAKTCIRCGATEGEALGHDTNEPTCTESAVCKRCNEEIPALGHDWKEATCTEAKTCTRCGLTEGDALGHKPGASVRENEKKATCTENGNYDEVVYCSICKAELSRENKIETALGHTTTNGTCERCDEFIFEPIVFSGAGDKVISNVAVPLGMYKVVFSNRGKSNFIIRGYTADGERLSSLVNEIGNYDGSIVFTDDINGGILEVVSEGKWTISFEMIPGGGTSNISGSGDWVSPWFTLDSGALIVKMTNKGNSNFIILLYDEYGNRYSSLVNEIGTYEGEIVFNEGRDGVKYCIEVVSEGKWTIDFGLGDPLTSE